MLGIIWQRTTRRILAALLTTILGLSLVSCSNTQGSPGIPGFSKATTGNLAEVAPPAAIAALRQALEIYQPQVKILSPRPDEVLQDTQASVRLQVQDLPLFQNKDLELGPHLHFILDNRPYKAIYDISKPLVLEDLEPGTHTLRVFAARPWHESFKNEGAYTQTTFHIFTKTPEHNPASAQPLLTYSRPKGSYGAEPIMLDFYLTNAPLHLVAKESTEDEVLDWKVRCTIDGESFTIDRWQPIYLKGLRPGKNWVQLELLDENETPIPNVFNNTVRVINYEPGGTDSLSKLVRGEIDVSEARSIVDPNYTPPAVPEPTPESTPVLLPAPDLTTESTPEPLPEFVPSPIPTPLKTPAAETSSPPAPEKAAPEKPVKENFSERNLSSNKEKSTEENSAIPETEPDRSVEPEASESKSNPAPALPEKTATPPIDIPDTGKVKEELPEEVKELLNNSVSKSSQPQVTQPQITQPQITQPQITQPQAKGTFPPIEEQSLEVLEPSFLNPTTESGLDETPAIAPLTSPTSLPPPETSTLRELFNRSKGLLDQLLQHPAESTPAESIETPAPFLSPSEGLKAPEMENSRIDIPMTETPARTP